MGRCFRSGFKKDLSDPSEHLNQGEYSSVIDYSGDKGLIDIVYNDF